MKNLLSVIILLCLPFMAIAQELTWTTYFGPKEKEACFRKGLNKYFKETGPTSELDYARARLFIELACDGGEQKKYTIYPNPAPGQFTISGITEYPAHLTLFDLTGRVAKQATIENEQQAIDVSHLPKGLYVWQLGTARGKIIIQ